MIRDYFRVLVVDLGSGKGRVVKVEGRNEFAGAADWGHCSLKNTERPIPLGMIPNNL